MDRRAKNRVVRECVRLIAPENGKILTITVTPNMALALGQNAPTTDTKSIREREMQSTVVTIRAPRMEQSKK